LEELQEAGSACLSGLADGALTGLSGSIRYIYCPLSRNRTTYGVSVDTPYASSCTRFNARVLVKIFGEIF
jgi:hypothetical protein